MHSAYTTKDWSELTHAYGPAGDVPQLLRDLNSPDASVREEARNELFSNIWHQYTVYPATAKAFPELLALLESPDCIDRNSVAFLLACIADGDGYHHVHSLPETRDFCLDTITHTGATLRAELEQEADFLAAIRKMSIEALPLLLPYLDAPDWCLRESIAMLLQRYSAHIPDAATRLRNRLTIETHPEVKFRIKHALSIVQPAD